MESIEDNSEFDIKRIEEIKGYYKMLENSIAEFIGFEIEFPIRVDEETNEINMGDLNAKFPFNLKKVNDELIRTILMEISLVMEKYINKLEDRDVDLLKTISYDTSLSIIFPGYLEQESEQKYKTMMFMKNLIEISSMTYEASSVEIGIVILNENRLHSITNDLEMEVSLVKSKTGLKEFFYSEKPFLKLINNKSLAIVLNEKFEVYAILRKKHEGKSIGKILEGLYEDYEFNDLFKKIQQGTIDIIAQTELSQSLNVDHEEYKVIKEYMLEKISELDSPYKYHQPNFNYISIKDAQINFYTPNNFIITTNNGLWKIKHFNLLIAYIMQFVFSRQYPYITLMDKEELLPNFLKGINVLAKILKNLSINKTSSIIVILENEDLVFNMNTMDANKLLKKAKFRNNNLDKNFLQVIKDSDNHLNILQMDQYLFETLAEVDGAIVLDTNFNILSFGEVISVPSKKKYTDTYGTGTRASRFASKYGLVLKISEDGDVKLYSDEKLLLNI